MDIITAIFVSIIVLLMGGVAWFVYDNIRQSKGYMRLAELDREFWDALLDDDDDRAY